MVNKNYVILGPSDVPALTPPHNGLASACCRRPIVLLASLLFFAWGGLLVRAASGNSIARIWNERAIAAIRVDTPHPPAQARNCFSLSVAMYDAWAAYDTNGAVGYAYHGKQATADIAAARREAISYAAYRILKER